MKKIVVYSHDTFGLGNIRRMLSICTHLIDSIPDLLILLVSGSPMIHSFRIPQRLDYIKLPCLRRDEAEGYSVKYLGTEFDKILEMRSELILSAVANFKPDLFLIDKKPYGVGNELERALNYIKMHLPDTRQVLLLRDILDTPEATIRLWKKKDYYEAIQFFYDLVLIVGLPEVFDQVREYEFPTFVSDKVRYCGYTQREPGLKSRNMLRKELKVGDEKLILVTAGGGEDGFHLLETYALGLRLMPPGYNVKSVIICGPEMPEPQRKKLEHITEGYPHVTLLEFTEEMMSYMDAADIVVSMGGYNTICEIFSLKKRAIIVPRVRPVEEQWIRAKRMASVGLFKTIHPDYLTPQSLMGTLLEELDAQKNLSPLPTQINMGALPRISDLISTLMFDPKGFVKTFGISRDASGITQSRVEKHARALSYL